MIPIQLKQILLKKMKIMTIERIIKMKIYIFIIRIIIFTLISLCQISVGEQNNQLQSESSTIQEPKIISTFESINKWKATLFLQPITHKWTKRTDGTEVKEEHYLCYVGISPADSNEIYPVWQFIFANIPASVKFLPDKFVFGPADNNKLCLAFKYPYPTTSLCIFNLDPNSKEIQLYKETDEAFNGNDIKSPNMHIQDQDPNNFIPLSKFLGPNQLKDVAPVSVTINSICSYDNCAVFNLSGANRNFILRYSVVDGKPVYSVYKLNDLTK